VLIFGIVGSVTAKPIILLVRILVVRNSLLIESPGRRRT
jgi:hypothetical protein